MSDQFERLVLRNFMHMVCYKNLRKYIKFSLFFHKITKNFKKRVNFGFQISPFLSLNLYLTLSLSRIFCSSFHHQVCFVLYSAFDCFLFLFLFLVVNLMAMLIFLLCCEYWIQKLILLRMWFDFISLTLLMIFISGDHWDLILQFVYLFVCGIEDVSGQ